MGRKSLKKERTKQIIDAFEFCIIKYGLATSSLPKIAQQAGVQLSGIHHHIGNRNDLIKVMLDRFVERYSESFEVFCNQRKNTLNGFISFLFGNFSETSEDHIIFDELFNLSSRDPYVKGLLNGLYKNFINRFTNIIEEAHPNATRKKCQKTAAVIISLWFGHLSMMSVGIQTPSLSNSSKSAAKLILEKIED